MNDRIFRYAAILCSLLLAALVVYLNRNFYHDDAYITLRYARNLISGFGLTWNPGEFVQGYTSFLHVMTLSFLGWLGVDLVMATRVVGFASLAGLLGVVTWFGAALRMDRAAPVWPLAAAIVITSPPILVWSLGGLEGVLFGFLVAGSCLLLATDSSREPWPCAASGFLGGLSFLARPDGIVFISVSLAWLLWLTLRRRLPFGRFGVYLIGLIAAMAPYLIWQALYYGELVPNTYYVKAGSPLSLRLESGIRYLKEYLVAQPLLPILLCGALLHAMVKRRWSPKLTYLVLLIAAYGTYIVFVGGDHMEAFRFFVPVIPLMSATLTLALCLSVEPKSRAPFHYLTLAVLIVAGIQLQDRRLMPQWEDPASYVGTIVGKYIEKAWPAGSLVALNSAGATPFYARSHRYIDMLGLNDPAIARRRVEKVAIARQRIPGHFKGDGKYVLSRRPDYIIIGFADGNVASEPKFLSDLELSRDRQFHREYAPVKVSLNNNGHPVKSGGLAFTYYKKVGVTGERSTALPPFTANGASVAR